MIIALSVVVKGTQSDKNPNGGAGAPPAPPQATPLRLSRDFGPQLFIKIDCGLVWSIMKGGVWG